MNVCILNFSPHCGPVINSDTNRNECQYRPISNKIISHIEHLYKVRVANFQENPSNGTRNKEENYFDVDVSNCSLLTHIVCSACCHS